MWMTELWKLHISRCIILCCAAERLHIIHKTILLHRQWIKGAPTYEGFLAGLHVFSSVWLYLQSGIRVSGAWMSVCCRASRWLGAWERCLWLQPFCKYTSLSFSLSSFQWLSLQLWSEKPSIQRQITFPAALPSLPLCPLYFFLLSLCVRWDQIAETKDLWRTCLASSAPHPPTPYPPPSYALFLPGEHWTKQKQVSGYGSQECGSSAGGETSFYDKGTTWGTDNGLFNWPLVILWCVRSAYSIHMHQPFFLLGVVEAMVALLVDRHRLSYRIGALWWRARWVRSAGLTGSTKASLMNNNIFHKGRCWVKL